MAFNEGIKVFFGGDTSGLRNSIHDAESQVKGFTRGLGKQGRELNHLFEFGGVFALGLALKEAGSIFIEQIDKAQKLRDKLEEAGMEVDKNTEKMASFKDSLDEAKESAGKVASGVISFATNTYDWLKKTAYAIAGVSRADQEWLDKLNTGAEKSLRAIKYLNDEKMKHDKEQRNPYKIKTLDDQIADQSVKNDQLSMTAAEKLNSIKDQIANKEKEVLTAKNRSVDQEEKALELTKLIGEYEKQLLDIKKSYKLGLEEQKQLQLLLAKSSKSLTQDEAEQLKLLTEKSRQKAIQVNIQDLLDKGVENLTPKELKTLSVLMENLKVQDRIVDAKKAEISYAQDQIDKEQKILELKQKQGKAEEAAQKGFDAGIGGIVNMQSASSEQLQSASNDDLKAYIQRQLNNAEQFSNPALNEGMASGNASKLTNRLNAASFTAAAEKARQELERRNKLQSDINFGGTDYARQNYQGNILNFDKMVSQLETGVTKTDRTNQLLEKMNNTLDKSLKNG